jgi:hypothetical protein
VNGDLDILVGRSQKPGGGLPFLLWGLAVLALCLPAVTNFRGYADWFTRRNGALFKTPQQAVRYHRCFAAVFVVLAIGAITLGVYRIFRL